MASTIEAFFKTLFFEIYRFSLAAILDFRCLALAIACPDENLESGRPGMSKGGKNQN
jgi:hypothetical protein